MSLKNNIPHNTELTGSYTLLSLLIIQLFIINILPLEWHFISYNIVSTLIYFTLIMVINLKRRLLIPIILSLIVLEWVSYFFKLSILVESTFIFNIGLFCFVIIKFIIQVAQSRHVDMQVILHAINGYLLLGILGGVIINFIIISDVSAFSFPDSDIISANTSILDKSQYIGLVTLSTLGYGDIIPLSPIARSATTLTSIIGQLYLAILIALLVGKFSNNSSD